MSDTYVYRAPWEIAQQDGEPFKAICPCPACGVVALHYMRRPLYRDKDEVTRTCWAWPCQFSWGQW